MKYKVLFTEEADRDLMTIEHYFTNREASLKYIQSLLNKVENLQSYPNLGLKVANSIFEQFDTRYLIAGNHVVYYRVNDVAKCVYIYAIVLQTICWKSIVNKDIVIPNNIITHDERLTIKHMDTSMFYDVWINSLDVDNRKYVPDEVFETLEIASSVVDDLIECYQSEEGPFVYAIIRNEDKANIGYVQLINIGIGWEIGYHIAKRYTGNGYATEAVLLFLDYLKKNTNHKEIIGVALASNKASRRVLSKCGFIQTFEGIDYYQGKKRKIIRSIKTL